MMGLFLTRRSHDKELLDRQDIPFEDIRVNMQELDLINTYLGGHKISIDGLKILIKGIAKRGHQRPISIAELGCGGGDNLLSIQNWCRKHDIAVQLSGIDINPACIEFAKSNAKTQEITFICLDYRKVRFEQTPDILFSSLFCHHFTEDELILMFRWMEKNSLVGYFINDLQRNIIAYHSIRWLTRLFSRSYLVKNDAPLSVKRGFHRSELEKLFRDAAISDVTIKWKWAFRWLVIRRKTIGSTI